MGWPFSFGSRGMRGGHWRDGMPNGQWRKSRRGGWPLAGWRAKRLMAEIAPRGMAIGGMACQTAIGGTRWRGIGHTPVGVPNAHWLIPRYVVLRHPAARYPQVLNCSYPARDSVLSTS